MTIKRFVLIFCFGLLAVGLLAACERTSTSGAACTLVANSDLPLYSRPALDAGQFSTLAGGEQITMSGETASGWLGFEPGIAQAANVGIFRLRWVAPDSDVSLSGSCDRLPVYAPISATACYEMALADTPILEQPEDAAATITTLPAGGYTAVTGVTAQGWYQVNLGDGSLADSAGGQTGWIPPAAGNLNGQTCAALPVVSP